MNTKTFNFIVTPKDIENRTDGSFCGCPLFQMFNRRLVGAKVKAVTMSHVVVENKKGKSIQYRLPENAAQFSHDDWYNLEPKPIRFSMKFPVSFLTRPKKAKLPVIWPVSK